MIDLNTTLFGVTAIIVTIMTLWGVIIVRELRNIVVVLKKILMKLDKEEQNEK